MSVKLIIIMILSLALCMPALAAAEGYGPQMVVYHFNTNNPQTNLGGLKNIQNHLNALPKGQLTVEVLVHSAGWEMVGKAKADPKQVERMKALIDQGVVFKMCRNTLNDNKLNPETDLAIPMTVVPAGVAELTKLQMAGYAYIKP
ncbi:MAG: DsrE family protein [Deltaproteobacteria bacterium]|nr:DsrE family protein [Deltaproteobacteria bacterium]